MKFGLVLLIIIMVFLSCNETKKEAKLPLANYMQQMQTEYASIGNCIKTDKVDALDFHINNLEAICNKIETNYNENEKLTMPFNKQRAVYIDPIINNLKQREIINNKEVLKKAYNMLTINCKSCHTSNKVVPAFIPIEL